MIYFAEAEGLARIKIGFTDETDSEVRMKALKTGCPVPLNVLRTIPGERELEKELHRRFAACHIHGEWFHASPEILEFITSSLKTDPTGPGSNVRFVAIKVMTIGGKQITQTLFRQIVQRPILDWEAVWNAAYEPETDLPELDELLCGTPWGRVNYDCKTEGHFQLVWQQSGQLRRCLIASYPYRDFFKEHLPSIFDPQYGTYDLDRLSKENKSFFNHAVKLFSESYNRFAKLDHLFIGV